MKLARKGTSLLLGELRRMRKRVIELESIQPPGNLVETETEALLELISLLSSADDCHALPESLIVYLRNWSGCEAVGIRLRYGYDFPYYETSGFPEKFVLLENNLCLQDSRGQLVKDGSGRAVLECMCGNVIDGRIDPSLEFFTDFGSFWTNSTTELLRSTTRAQRQSRTRNRCNGEGYESVALIPLRFAQDRFGLLQFNDRRKGHFTPEKIVLLERIAANITHHLSGRKDDVRSLMILNEKEILLHRIFDSLRSEPGRIAGSF